MRARRRSARDNLDNQAEYHAEYQNIRYGVERRKDEANERKRVDESRISEMTKPPAYQENKGTSKEGEAKNISTSKSDASKSVSRDADVQTVGYSETSQV